MLVLDAAAGVAARQTPAHQAWSKVGARGKVIESGGKQVYTRPPVLEAAAGHAPTPSNTKAQKTSGEIAFAMTTIQPDDTCRHTVSHVLSGGLAVCSTVLDTMLLPLICLQQGTDLITGTGTGNNE